ncbi:hypothetical protein RsTz2092_08880 [Deferribacterales bacterium RsTz2092]|nr:hypothetical protein AGMMS49941_06230 [Deferribacterales bacterium]
MATTIKFPANIADRANTILLETYKLSADKYTISTERNGVTTVVVTADDFAYLPKPIIEMSEDKMIAYLTLYPAVGNNVKLAAIEAITDSIDYSGVKFGINKGLVSDAALLHQQGIILERHLVAEGIPVVNGKDAALMMHFVSAQVGKPKVSDGGNVDYKSQSDIIQVKEGDLLATKRPIMPGHEGTDVTGMKVKPLEGKEITLEIGEGVIVDPLGTHYKAKWDGYLEYSENKLAVHKVFVVQRNVDYSTGNVSFKGTVHIKGDVLSGFKVEAGQNVIVDGLCEDCEIVAGGDIEIKVGIKGSKENRFLAGGNITVGYAESANMCAKNDINIKKYAYNCDMGAGEKIIANTNDGIIAGGKIKAFQEVFVKQLGTHGNSQFTVSVGTKYYIDQAIESLRKQKKLLGETQKEMDEVLGKLPTLKPEVANNKSVMHLQDIRRELASMMPEISDKAEALGRSTKASEPHIKVLGKVYDGLTVSFFGNKTSTVHEKRENLVFYMDAKYDEVAWISLKDVANDMFG